MKKNIKTLGLLLSAFVFTAGNTAQACTNFLVTKGASKDGSTMITYAADSHELYGELYYYPAADYPQGAMLDITEWDTGRKIGQIPQVAHTYSVVGNMNEFQLAIAETTYGGRHELIDKDGLLDYGSLIYITLQRAKNAREAIQIIHELTSTYGYCSSGESLSISDPNEVWIMEIIGKGQKILNKKGEVDPKRNTKGMVWVAYRIPDGYISGHANQARITTIKKADGKTSITSKDIAKKINLPELECVYAHDVVSYAQNIGIYNGTFEDFSFSDVYAPLDFMAMRGCEARVWAGFRKANPAAMAEYEDYARGDNPSHRMPLWIKPDRPLTLNDVISFMRDHYEGSSMDMTKDAGAGPFQCPYRWRPMTFKVDGKEYMHERATSTQQTGFSFVTQSRSWLPNQIGGILWFGVDDTYSTCYAPMYCGITQIPECFRVGNGNMRTYSPTSAFWLFNRVTNFAYGRYKDMIVDIQKVQSKLENDFQQKVAANDAVMGKETDSKKLTAFANYFSNTQAKLMFDEWTNLDRYLLVKYIDGNVKKVDENGTILASPNGDNRIPFPDQPEYPQSFLKQIVESCGPNIEVKK